FLMLRFAFVLTFFLVKQKTACVFGAWLVGSEMWIRDSPLTSCIKNNRTNVRLNIFCHMSTDENGFM
ncbi:hypothetical protein DAX90_21085, partial [Salmonella enterica subsp. enterica]